MTRLLLLAGSTALISSSKTSHRTLFHSWYAPKSADPCSKTSAPHYTALNIDCIRRPRKWMWKLPGSRNSFSRQKSLMLAVPTVPCKLAWCLLKSDVSMLSRNGLPLLVVLVYRSPGPTGTVLITRPSNCLTKEIKFLLMEITKRISFESCSSIFKGPVPLKIVTGTLVESVWTLAPLPKY